MTLGEKISALRNQHEMSQGDLAEKMNEMGNRYQCT